MQQSVIFLTFSGCGLLRTPYNAPLPVHDFSPDAKKNIYAKLFKLHRGGKHVKAQGTYSGKRQSQTGAANKDAA